MSGKCVVDKIVPRADDVIIIKMVILLQVLVYKSLSNDLCK